MAALTTTETVAARPQGRARRPQLRLADISYASGAMAYTATTATAGEEDLARYLEEGRRVMGEAAPPDLAGGVGDLLDADFELLRWFDLPRSCLA